jgi:hypothetical protein
LEHYDIDKSFARMQRAYNFVMQGFERELATLSPEQTVSYKLPWKARGASLKIL